MSALTLQSFLDSIQLRTELSDAETEEIGKLLTTPGFKHLLGLLLGTRQTLLMGLAAYPITNFENAAKASVIQGQIKGIELVSQTLLELFHKPEPTGAKK